MVKEANSVNKLLYQLFLIILKVIPYIIALAYAIYTLFSFYDIELIFIGYLCNCSIFTWIFIYISSFLFKYCIYHRIPLYYIVISDLINIIDTTIGIPVSTYNLLIIHYGIIGIFILLYIYLRLKYAKSFRRNA